MFIYIIVSSTVHTNIHIYIHNTYIHIYIHETDRPTRHPDRGETFVDLTISTCFEIALTGDHSEIRSGRSTVDIYRGQEIDSR